MEPSSSDERPELTGYADRFSVGPGESIRFMVHSEGRDFRGDLVRLIRGDDHPDGPGFKERPVESSVSGTYPGRHQSTRTGSFIAVEYDPAFDAKRLTLLTWIFPTLPASGQRQGLLAKWDAANSQGYALWLEPDGRLSFTVGRGSDEIDHVTANQPLRRWSWYFVAATRDGDTGEMRLYQWPLRPWPTDAPSVYTSFAGQGARSAGTGTPFLIGALSPVGDTAVPVNAQGCFNGKIARPAVFGSGLDESALHSLRSGAAPASVDNSLIAAWDFSRDQSSCRVTDISGRGHDGVAMNMPMRAATGPGWARSETDFRLVPQQYDAIHFHEDDLEDARWDVDFQLEVPADVPSGVYAARLQSGGVTDHIPFFVRPPQGRASAPILFLVPTFTYMAYANERLNTEHDFSKQASELFELDPRDQALARHPEYGLSCYDTHREGSGCCYSSRLRPIANLRPDYRWWLTGAPERLGADLSIVDWLEEQGYTYDVLTDEDLHEGGQALLNPYQVVITGTHPEYVSGAILDAVEGYLGAGGRLMYLGGNGFYWVTSVDAERPYVIEIRRGINGTRSWEPAPGEGHHSSTGEPGGLWRYRGRSPNALIGVGFTSQGTDIPSPGYRRLPDSFDERAAWIFNGIGRDEIIGDFGLVMGGAAGYEIDRLDYALGSPEHTLLLATSSGLHSDFYQLVVEDILMTEPGQGGTEEPRVRADITLLEWPHSGAVFSVGSINWAGSLCWNNYDNNVSRITRNVLENFLSRPAIGTNAS